MEQRKRSNADSDGKHRTKGQRGTAGRCRATSRGMTVSATTHKRKLTAARVPGGVQDLPQKVMSRPLVPSGYLAIVVALAGDIVDTRVRIAALGCLGIVAIVALLGGR